MTSEDKDFDARLRAGFGNPARDNSTGSALETASLESRSGRVRNPHRTKAVATGSLLGLGSLAVVAVVVTTAILPNQAPLFSLADSGQGGARAESALSDASMGWGVEYNYRAGEGLGSDTGRGMVYQLELQGTPEGVLATVAERFGVAGAPAKSEYFDPQWPLYVIGAEDWSAPSVNVTWSGTGNWYYNNPAAYPQSDNPEPAGPSISTQQAKIEAAALFSATGLVVSADDITVLTNDEWGVGVSASLTIDGVATALEWTMFWAPGPVLASASGHSITVRERGVFDTVSPVAAVDRLSSGMWWGAPSPSYYLGIGIGIGIAESSMRDAEGPDISYETPAEEPEVIPEQPVEGPIEEREPPAEMPLPEPIVPGEVEVINLTVTAAEPTLLLVWDASGNAWLVPGYVMRHGEDPWAWSTVISLEEGVIQIPEPMPVTIMPVPEPSIEQ